MDKGFDQIRALNEFKNNLKYKAEYGNDGFQFKGLVNYELNGKTVSEELDVVLIIGGYDPCVQLDVNENGRNITSDNFHMDFNPRFKNTEFQFNSKNSSLIIIGKNSPKMGNYKLEILEL